MKRITEYQMTYHARGTENSISETVNDAIEQGWTPFGGISTVLKPGTTYAGLFQPMVKYKD